jgi:hypothetical protein
VTSDVELRTLEIALEHARSWQKLHAEQRLRALDFFLVAAAFLTTAYVTSIATSPQLAAVVAGVGSVMSFAVNRLELRARALVKRGEDALRPLEARLAELTDNPALRLVDLSEASPFLMSYAKVFGMLHWLALLGFAAGAIFALRVVIIQP